MVIAASTLAAATTLLTACGAGGPGSAARGGAVRVVASTNVYGDITRAVGGKDVQVTSILSNPDQDPHSFEADPRTALAVSKADLVIENGGGYDDYMDRLRKIGRSTAGLINVVDLSGKKAVAGGNLNEHVFYDLPTMRRLADDIATTLSKLDSDHAKDFQARAERFNARLDKLITKEGDLRARFQGITIGITEPVPLYLTAACGLVNKTPAGFSEAIEEGGDVAAPVLQQTLDLYRRREVKALVYNVQTSGPLTAEVRTAAEDAGVSVVPVTETLPRGKDYIGWMSANLSTLASAVRG